MCSSKKVMTKRLCGGGHHYYFHYFNLKNLIILILFFGFIKLSESGRKNAPNPKVTGEDFKLLSCINDQKM